MLKARTTMSIEFFRPCEDEGQRETLVDVHIDSDGDLSYNWSDVPGIAEVDMVCSMLNMLPGEEVYGSELHESAWEHTVKQVKVLMTFPLETLLREGLGKGFPKEKIHRYFVRWNEHSELMYSDEEMSRVDEFISNVYIDYHKGQ